MQECSGKEGEYAVTVSEMKPFVRNAVNSMLDRTSERDVFCKLRTRDCRLFYIVSGKGQMVIEGKSYPLEPDCVILFPSGLEYIWEPDHVRYIAVNFDYTFRFSHIRKTFHPLNAEGFDESCIFEQVTFSDAPELNAPLVMYHLSFLKTYAERLFTERYLGGEYTDEYLSMLLKTVILTLLRTDKERRKSSERQSAAAVRTVIAYICEHYAERISLEDIAALSHFNYSYLNRVFRKHTGETIHSFLIRYRLGAAMEILRTQNTPIAEIAELTGFSDPAHFSKAFRKYCGKSPTEYRISGDN